jgi:uncharacterized protein YerC
VLTPQTSYDDLEKLRNQLLMYLDWITHDSVHHDAEQKAATEIQHIADRLKTIAALAPKARYAKIDQDVGRFHARQRRA